MLVVIQLYNFWLYYYFPVYINGGETTGMGRTRSSDYITQVLLSWTSEFGQELSLLRKNLHLRGSFAVS